MSYETKVQVMREYAKRPASETTLFWRSEDGQQPTNPRAVLIEGGPLPGDEVVHAAYGRCTVEAVEPWYTLRKLQDGFTVTGCMSRYLSPAPDPTEALREKIRHAIQSNYATSRVMDILKAEGLLGGEDNG